MKKIFYVKCLVILLFGFFTIKLNGQNRKVERALKAFEEKNWIELNQESIRLMNQDSNSSNFFFVKALTVSIKGDKNYNDELKYLYFGKFFEYMPSLKKGEAEYFCTSHRLCLNSKSEFLDSLVGEQLTNLIDSQNLEKIKLFTRVSNSTHVKRALNFLYDYNLKRILKIWREDKNTRLALDYIDGYIDEYPESPYMPIVNTIHDTVLFYYCIEENTFVLYEHYFKLFPNGKYCKNVLDKIDSLILVNISNYDNDQLKYLITNYPKIEHSSLIKKAIEENLFNSCISSNDKNNCLLFLNEFPQSTKKDSILEIIFYLDLKNAHDKYSFIKQNYNNLNIIEKQFVDFQNKLLNKNINCDTTLKGTSINSNSECIQLLQNIKSKGLYLFFSNRTQDLGDNKIYSLLKQTRSEKPFFQENVLCCGVNNLPDLRTTPRNYSDYSCQLFQSYQVGNSGYLATITESVPLNFKANLKITGTRTASGVFYFVAETNATEDYEKRELVYLIRPTVYFWEEFSLLPPPICEENIQSTNELLNLFYTQHQNNQKLFKESLIKHMINCYLFSESIDKALYYEHVKNVFNDFPMFSLPVNYDFVGRVRLNINFNVNENNVACEFNGYGVTDFLYVDRNGKEYSKKTNTLIPFDYSLNKSKVTVSMTVTEMKKLRDQIDNSYNVFGDVYELENLVCRFKLVNNHIAEEYYSATENIYKPVKFRSNTFGQGDIDYHYYFEESLGIQLTIDSVFFNSHYGFKTGKKSDFLGIGYSKNSEVIVFNDFDDSKYAPTDFAVLQTTQQNLKGVIGWSAQGMNIYYIEGTLSGKSYTGDVYALYYENGNPSKINPVGRFELIIEDSRIVILRHPVGHNLTIISNQISKVYGDPSFFEGSTVFAEPNRNANVIYILPENQKCNILEVGKLESLNGQTNLWYRIKTGNVTGWIFGDLDILSVIEETTDK